MQYRAADTETIPITDTQKSPPLVCVSSATDTDSCLYRYTDAGPVLWQWFSDPNTIIEGHNFGSFDLPVILSQYPELTTVIMQSAADGRIRDTMLDQKILDLAFGSFRGKYEKDGSWTQHNYGLDDLCFRYLHRRMKKGEDSWQLRYGEIREVPVEYWPHDAKEYAIGDSVVTRKVHAKQLYQRDAYYATTKLDLLHDSAPQLRAALWLGLMQAHGIRIDVSKITLLEQAILEDYAEQESVLRAPYPIEPCPAMVFVKPVRATHENPYGVPGYTYQCGQYGCEQHGLIRPDGTKDQKKAKVHMIQVMREAGRLPKMTKTGIDKMKVAEKLPDVISVEHATAEIPTGEHTSVKLLTPKVASTLQTCGMISRDVIIDYLGDEYIALDKEACEDADDEVLTAYAALTKLKSVLSKDVPKMRLGRIFAEFNSLLRTGRTSCRGYNLQNPSRKGGVRECFIPDEGYDFAMIDLDGAELRGMAQVCLSLFGWSKLADALNAGKDPHLMLGANLLGITYEQILEEFNAGVGRAQDARQMAKVGNFGFAGGMGAKKFRIYAKASYGTVLTEAQVKWLKAKWSETWPEFNVYFKLHGALTEFPGMPAWATTEGLPRDFGEIPSGGWFIEQSSGRLHTGLRYSQLCNMRFQALIATAFKASGWALCRACYDPSLRSVLYGSRPVNEIHDEHIVQVPQARAAECAAELGRIVLREVAPFLPGVPPSAKPYLTRMWSKNAFPVYDGPGFKTGNMIAWNGHVKNKKTGEIELPKAA